MHSTQDSASICNHEQDDLFYSIQEPMLATANIGKTRERFLEENAGEWTGSVEISQEEFPGSKRSMCDFDLLPALKGEPLSSVFSTDETLIFTSAAPHCGAAAARLKSRLKSEHSLQTANLYLSVCLFLEVRHCLHVCRCDQIEIFWEVDCSS